MGTYSKIKQDDEGLAGILPTMSADMLPSCTLHRSLSFRQAQMIAIGGTIGTGLFLCTGRSLAQGGPATMLICYSVVGFIVYITLLLGEMATQYPIAGESLDGQSRLSESGSLVPNVGTNHDCHFIGFEDWTRDGTPFVGGVRGFAQHASDCQVFVLAVRITVKDISSPG